MYKSGFWSFNCQMKYHWLASKRNKRIELNFLANFLLFPRVPRSSTQSLWVQHISSTQDHTLSAPKIPQFNTKIPQIHIKNPSVQHTLQFNTNTPQFHTPLSSTPNTPQFHTSLSFTQKTPQFNTPFSSTPNLLSSTHLSILHQKRLSSTPKTPQFNTKNASVQYPLSSRSVWLRDFWCGTERCVELKGFSCRAEGFWGLKRVTLLSGTDVFNWAELDSTPIYNLSLRPPLSKLLRLRRHLPLFRVEVVI